MKITVGDQVATVRNGTVVSFMSGPFTYAAIFFDGLWYITGNGKRFGGNTFTPAGFIDLLAEASTVKLASAWVDVL